MLTFILFLCAAIYEDARSVREALIRKPTRNRALVTVDTAGEDDLRLTIHGRYTEHVYFWGLLVGALVSHYKIIFFLILFMAQLPKKKLWWICMDSVLSTLLLLLAFVLTYSETILVFVAKLFV